MITANNFQKTLKKPRVQSKITLYSVWAAWIQHKTDRLPLKVKVIILLLFCLTASASCIYLIADSLLSKKPTLLKIKPIEMPIGVNQLKDENTQAAIISETEYQKIHEYRLYIDSLIESASGKAFHDSLLQRYSGLMDSIRFIENIYHSQNKN